MKTLYPTISAELMALFTTENDYRQFLINFKYIIY
jgi:hypothetical protein